MEIIGAQVEAEDVDKAWTEILPCGQNCVILYHIKIISLNMATITRSLSSKVNANGEAEIMLRLSVSRELRLRLKSGIFVEATRFRDGKIIMPRADRKTLAKLQIINDNLVSLESRLISLCVSTPQKSLSKEFSASPPPGTV